MPIRSSSRVLRDGTPLHNRLLAALPDADYRRISRHLRIISVKNGESLRERGSRLTNVYFPNGGVFSVATEMGNGALVEVGTVGREGMLGVGVFLGDPVAPGRMFQQVADGSLLSMAVADFRREITPHGPFRTIVALYAQANLLQTMQGSACNALHHLKSRCCRWLLETHDRVDSDDFGLKQEFLAVMLGVHRPTVTVVMRSLQKAGVVSSRYGRIRILNRKPLERAACECYEVVKAHFERLGL